jgi:hypothetical protein
VRQQFGVVGPVLAAGGLASLMIGNRPGAVLVLLLYAVNVGFAYSYNVGDAHVFYLPSHLVVALLAGCGVAAVGRVHRRAMPVAAALSRRTVSRASRLPRPRSQRRSSSGQVMQALAGDLDIGRRSSSRSQLAAGERPGLLRRSRDRWWRTPACRASCVRAGAGRGQRAIGRDVTLTARAAAAVTAYGPCCRSSRIPA